MQQTENDIVELKKGNRTIFRRIFETEATGLISLASFYVDPDTAQDIVQDVFVNLWSKRKELDEKQILSHFLKVIVKNKCLNTLRHLKVKQKLTAEALGDLPELDEQAYAAQLEKIRYQINLLSPVCQQVLRLNIYSNMKYDEIAETLGISKNTVKFHIKTAYRQLRANLHPEQLNLLLFLLSRTGL